MPKTCDNVTIERVEKTAQNEAVSSNSLLGKNSLNFVRFVKVPAVPKNPQPASMEVGQVVVRQPCGKQYRLSLKTMMRGQMKMGKTFSIHEDAEKFAIRRDT